MNCEIQFEEWFEKDWTDQDWLYEDCKNFDPFEMKGAIQHAFMAGYNQRSSEVAEDLRIFNNLMSYVDTEH